MPSGKEDATYDALPDNEDIRKEYERLLKLFEGANAKKLELAKKEIARAAFLTVTIGKLEEDINTNGYKEEYQNGENQKGIKKSAAAELHVSYMKNFLAVMKQLHEYLDPVANEDSGDDFDKF